MVLASLPLLLIIIFGIAIHLLLNFKIEISVFLAVCIITLLTCFFAITGVLSIGLYVVYAIISISAIYTVFFTIKERKKFLKIFSGIFTPGILILLISYFAYYIVIRDKVLIYRDEATSWVIEIKHMYTTGVFKNYGSHPNIIAFFSLFFTKISEYNEPMVFLSRWMFVWSCLIMLLSSITWKEWIKALLFAIGAYCIISVINPDAIYYMDMPLGVLAGALCAAWSVKKKKKKDYIWLYSGVVILFAIKDEIGIAIGFLVLLFLISCDAIRYFNTKPESRKIDYKQVGLNAGLIAIGLAFFIMSMRKHNYISSVLNEINSIYVAIAIILTIALLLIVFIFRRKINTIVGKLNKKVIIAIIIFIASVILYKFISVLYSSFEIDKQKMFYEGISIIYNKGYFGKPAYLLTALMIIFIGVLGLVMLDKESSKVLLVQGFIITLMITAYSFVLLIGYIYDTQNFNGKFLQIQRYYGPIFILASLWLLARLVSSGLVYKKKCYSLIAILILMSILIKELPKPGNLMFGNMEQFRYSVTYGLRRDLRNDSILIEQNVKDGDILIIAQPENNKWDVFSAIAWIRYEILPIEGKGIVLTDSIGNYDGLLATPKDKEDLLSIVEKNNIGYIYIYSIDDYLFDEFGFLFEPWGGKTGKLLYNVTPQSEYYFTLLDAE